LATGKNLVHTASGRSTNAPGQEVRQGKSATRTLHEKHALLPGGIAQLGGVPRVHRHWLLAEHVLSGGDGVEGVGAVEHVGRADVDNVYVGVVVDAGVRVVDGRLLRRAVFGEKRLALFLGRRADRLYCVLGQRVWPVETEI
jgi:hypothetical protein